MDNRNLDLYKNKKTEAETFDHFFTVLYCILSNARDFENRETETEEEWELNNKLAGGKCEEAKRYLREYMELLLNQNAN